MASRFQGFMAYEPEIAGISGLPQSAPMQSGISVPSWLTSGNKDRRGTTPASMVSLNPGTEYVLVDYTGENDNTVLARGSTAEDLSRIQNIIQNDLAPKGRRADWRLMAVGDAPQEGAIDTKLDDATGKYVSLVGGDLYNKPIWGTIADIALPVAGAVLAPLTGGGSAALMAGLGAAGGSTLSSVAQGRGLGDTLLRAALSGGLSAGAAGIGGALGGGAIKPATAPGMSVVVNPVGGLGGGVLNIPAMTAPSIAGIGGAVASAIPGEMLVQGSPIAAPSIASGALGGIGAGIGSGIAGIGGSVPSVAAVEDPEIVVDIKPTDSTGSLGAALGGAAISMPAIDAVAPVKSGGLSADKIVRGGLGGLSLINGLSQLLGGNGDAGGGPVAGFNPNAGLVSYQPLSRQQIAPTFDPFTYGQSGGEFRFFTDASPQYQTNQPAMVMPQGNPPRQFARGGMVRGIGGGQDDLIDAKLSDGEYVISAQDVSDLGDGSNEEGARRLDEMRRLIRKQAGRKNIRSIAKPQKNVRSILKAVR